MIRLFSQILFFRIICSCTLWYSMAQCQPFEAAIEEGKARLYFCGNTTFCWGGVTDGGTYCWSGPCTQKAEWKNAIIEDTSFPLEKGCNFSHPRNLSGLTVTGDAISGLCSIEGGKRPQNKISLITVYKKPETPVCQLQDLSDQSTIVNITCTTEAVYPRAHCQFLHSLDVNFTLQPDTLVWYSHKMKKKEPASYQSWCSLITGSDNIPEGKNYFRVIMYPEHKTGLKMAEVPSDTYSIIVKRYHKTGSGTDVIIIGLSVALGVVTAVSVVQSILLVRQRKKAKGLTLPHPYDITAPDQEGNIAVYQDLECVNYLSLLPPGDDGYEETRDQAYTDNYQSLCTTKGDNGYETTLDHANSENDVSPYSFVNDGPKKAAIEKIYSNQEKSEEKENTGS